MIRKLAGLMVALMLLALMLLGQVEQAGALSTSQTVTKETQAREGLDFSLSAVRESDEAVIVRMEIPKKGKLQNLQKVRMVISEGKSILLWSNLEITTTEDGASVVSFQISPDLADKCSISLVTESSKTGPANEFAYAVELKGYITVSLRGQAASKK